MKKIDLSHWIFVVLCTAMLFGIFGYMFWDMYRKNITIKQMREDNQQLGMDTINLNDKVDACYLQLEKYYEELITCRNDLKICKENEIVSATTINDILEVKK